MGIYPIRAGYITIRAALVGGLALLAMDTEENAEVVWNEIQFSEGKTYKLLDEKVKPVTM